MTRGSRASRERRSTAIDEQNDSEDEASVRAVEDDSYVKHGNTPSRKRWSSSEDSSRPYGREIKTVSMVLRGRELKLQVRSVVNVIGAMN